MTQTAPAESEDLPTGAPRGDEMGDGERVPGAAAVNTRERILDVALDLFIEQGFDGASHKTRAERMP